MTPEEAKKRIHQLTKELDEHNYLYYVQAKPVISDYDFDMMLEELTRLEKLFPEFASPDSPTQRVGGAITKEFKTVKHKYPMLSLANTYSADELREFDERVKSHSSSDCRHLLFNLFGYNKRKQLRYQIIGRTIQVNIFYCCHRF